MSSWGKDMNVCVTYIYIHMHIVVSCVYIYMVVANNVHHSSYAAPDVCPSPLRFEVVGSSLDIAEMLLLPQKLHMYTCIHMYKHTCAN